MSSIFNESVSTNFYGSAASAHLHSILFNFHPFQLKVEICWLKFWLFGVLRKIPMKSVKFYLSNQDFSLLSP